MLATEITLRDILHAIAQMTDAELIQLKCAARKEMERRNLKLSRHTTQHSAPERRSA
jgi:hypothetical protein